MRVFTCALALFVAFHFVQPAKATDLRPVQYVLLYGQLRALMAAQLAIEIANDNRLPAVNYSVDVTIRNKASGTVVYQATIPGQNINPYTHLTLLLSQLWIPLTSGLYTVTTSISFADDINPANNTLVQDATVYPAAVIAALYWNAYVRPFVNRDRSHATFQYRYGPSSVFRYLNVRAWSIEGLPLWLLRNQAVPPSQDSVTMQQNVDLHNVLLGSKPDSVKFSYDLADTLLKTDTTLKGYTWLDLDSTKIYHGGVLDTNKPTSFTLTPVTIPIGDVVTDGLVWGCRVPNLDLDSANHPYNADSDFAGDINACAPTSAANSMQWLEQQFPMTGTGLTHRQKMEELGRAMRRAKEEGVFSEDFVRGKLEFINKYDLPIKVKFQIRGNTGDIESDDEYIKTAKNQGNGGYPSWDWLKGEVKDSEDVEMFVEYHQDSGSGSTVVGRHAVVITGASQSSTGKDLWYKDDATQERSGGTRERKVSWDTLQGGVPYFDGWKDASGKAHVTVPFFACSESYDSSVHRVGRSTIGKLWKGFKGFVFGKRGVLWSVDHTASTTLHFANAFSPSLPATALYNIPVGGDLGESVTLLVDSTHRKGVDTDTLWMNVWYADTLIKTRPIDTIPHTGYRILLETDSTKFASPTLGGEGWRPGPGKLAWPSWTEGTFTPADTSTRWLKVRLTDLDSTSTKSMYPDTLSDRGASGQGALSDILQAIDSTTSSIVLPDSPLQRRIALSTNCRRGRQGTGRVNMINGALDYIDAVRAPIRVRYQSASISDAEIKATSSAHVARNETGSSGAPDAAWMLEQLRAAPLLVELGWYGASGRTGGTWALLNGWMNYNGVKRIIMDRDLREGQSGGVGRTIGTLVQDNGALSVIELAPLDQRCIIETAVSLAYDPTIVFTSVSEDVSREIADLVVIPNPASTSMMLRAMIARSAMATVQIVDALGSVRSTMIVSADALRNGIQVNLSTISQGSYAVRITTDNAVLSQRFIKVDE